MTVRIEGFARTLARCLDFEGIPPESPELVLIEAGVPLQVHVVEPSSETPLIPVVSVFTHLFFGQRRTLTPLEFPRSVLVAPFLVGIHEFSMGTER